MNIIFDTENIDQIKNNNILLELDTFYFAKLHKTSTAYCVVDNIRLTEFDKNEQHQRLHADMIDAYKNKDFKLCQDLQEHLIGAFSGELDSFYSELANRITVLKASPMDQDWTPVICRED
jgi:hypothetical protein